MKNKICLIYNYAQHYRTDIFCLMDKELPIDFVFGDKYLDVKKMDYSLLKNFKKEVKNITFFMKPIYYQKGVLKLIFTNYSSYLILGETICVSTWVMLFICKVLNKKVYFWTHGWYGKETLIRKTLKKIFYSLSNGIFLYGDYAKSLMIKEGFNEKKLHVIYNSLSYDSQKKERKALGVSDIYFNKFNNRHKNLVFIGRLSKVKRLDMILDALKILKSKNKYYNLTLIGEGETKNNLKQIVKQFNLEECVWFYGESFNENELSNLIFNADLCVSPGNVGLTAIHSLTYGTPVITHNNFPYQMPEFEVIKLKKTGIFFEFGNVISLANKIQCWFNENNNREKVREACYEVVDKKFNPYYQIEIFKKHLI